MIPLRPPGLLFIVIAIVLIATPNWSAVSAQTEAPTDQARRPIAGDPNSAAPLSSSSASIAADGTTWSLATIRATGIRVNVMPSTFGADFGMPVPGSWVGRENILWGNVVGGTPPYEYRFELGDGTPDATGIVTDPRYIRTRHSFNTLGPKFLTLTVTDADGESNSESFRIDVGPFDLDTRVRAAIEDGLRVMYLEQASNGDWPQASTGDGFIAHAFQLWGHDRSNDPDVDIYAETLDAFWHYIFDRLLERNIAPQPAGNPDTNGNGIGIYAVDYTQSHDFGPLLMAMLSLELDAVIPVGSQAGRTVGMVAQDMLDLLYYSQHDTGSQRGGWRYNVLFAGAGADNSSVHWPLLAIIAAEDRGLVVPEFVKNELEIWTLWSQGPSGGFGYTQPGYWENLAKTGSGLLELAWLGYDQSSSQVLAALDFMATRWNWHVDVLAIPEHLTNNLFAMYSVKTGLLRHSPPIRFVGAHNWQLEYNKTLVDDPADEYDGVGGVLFDNDNLEQTRDPNDYIDGAWRSGYWTFSGFGGTGALSTAFAVLVLTDTCCAPVVVAHCNVSPSQAGPGEIITLDGSGSSHQDPSHQIVAYAWDFDDSDGVDFGSPDATGPIATTSYALGPGELSRQFTIALQVTDDIGATYETRCSVLIERGPYDVVALPGSLVVTQSEGCVEGGTTCVDGYLTVSRGDGDSAPLPNLSVEFYLNDPQDPAQRLARFEDTEVAVGSVLNHSVCFTRDADDITPTVYMVVDPDGVVNESDESNNLISLELDCLVPVARAILAGEAREEGNFLRWELVALEGLQQLELLRHSQEWGDELVGRWLSGEAESQREHVDRSVVAGQSYRYSLRATTEYGVVRSNELVLERRDGLPARSGLLGNAPNPFNPRTTLRFALAGPGDVAISLHDSAGRLVRRWEHENLAAGIHTQDWDGRDAAGRRAASGVYFVRLRSADSVDHHRMTLLK